MRSSDVLADSAFRDEEEDLDLLQIRAAVQQNGIESRELFRNSLLFLV